MSLSQITNGRKSRHNDMTSIRFSEIDGRRLFGLMERATLFLFRIKKKMYTAGYLPTGNFGGMKTLQRRRGASRHHGYLGRTYTTNGLPPVCPSLFRQITHQQLTHRVPSCSLNSKESKKNITGPINGGLVAKRGTQKKNVLEADAPRTQRR